MAENLYQIASRTEPSGVIEEAGTMETLASNSEGEMIASMTEPRLKKPKLDDGVIEEAVTIETLESNCEEETEMLDDWVNDEVETVETLDSIKQGTSTDKDIADFVEEIGKKLFVEVLSELCKDALAHYRQGESYKFEGVKSLFLWSESNLSDQYLLEFCAKDMNAVGYPLKHFKAFFSSGVKDRKVLKCVLHRDDEMMHVDLKKLNLVDSDDDEEEIFENLYSGPVYDSDFEMEENFEPELGFPLVELCTSALDYYHIKHPRDRYVLDYELERGLDGFRATSYGDTKYSLEFFAKSMKAEGNPIRKKFEAGVLYLAWDKPEEFVVKKCVLVKDGEVELSWSMDCATETTPPEYIPKKESAKYDEFCILCLNVYKNNSGGCYEFVKRLTSRRRICEGVGVQYVFVFHAKQPGSSELIKFMASGYNKRRVIEPYRCELIEDQDSVLD